MRLTLRTLLAYRDRVLNPAELEDMHARVQQNAMAGNLIKRIDALSQRANILAPPIDGKGLGADANSIAEYLDDSLKGDKVPELERICLESDVQLAELAQCHYLLSTALSTPVEVQPALRWRIAAWGDPTARQKALADRPTGLLIEPELKSGSADGSSGRRRKSRFRTEPAQNAPVQAAPVQAATSQAATAQNDSAQTESGAGNVGVSEGKTATNHHLRLVTAQPVEAPMVASGGDSIRPSGLDLEGSHMAHEVPEYLRGRSRDGWRGPLAIGGLVAILCLLVWQSMGSLSSVREMFTMRPPQNGNGQAARDGASVANSEVNGASNSEVNNAAKSPNAANVDPSVGGPLLANGEANRLENGRAPGVAADSRPKDATPAEQAGISPTESSSNNPSTNPGTNPGNIAGGSAAGPLAAHWLPADANAMQSVLLVQSIGGALHRLEPTESMPIGTQIFVPPANRPTLDLNAGPLWTVCSMTHMELASPDAGANASTPHIGLRLGRAVVRESSRGRSLALSSPVGTANLTLDEAGSELAVDLSYQPVAHGQVTDRAAHAPVLTLSMLAGSSTVEFGGRSIKLPAGHTVMLQANLAAQPTAAESPVWIDPANDRPVDQLAALDLARQMTNDRSIGESLKELSTNRRPEMRALAAQTLSLLGNWDWVASPKGSLSDARDRSFWTPLLDGTRQILAAHPENVEALQSALQSLDADAVAWRTDMWLGLDSAQLSGDGLGKLVKTLESDILLDRILAIYHLQRVTGKDLGYQAGEPSRAAIGQWTRELTNVRLTPTPL